MNRELWVRKKKGIRIRIFSIEGLLKVNIIIEIVVK
jgi:hypothetical protein